MGVSEQEIRERFSSFGSIECIVRPLQQPFVVVCFATTEQAVAARSALNKQRVSDNPVRVVTIGFARLMNEKQESEDEKLEDVTHPHDDDNKTSKPRGLVLIPDFVSAEEEKILLNEIESQPWDASIRRRVQHYGYAFNYVTRKVDASMRIGPLPDFVGFLLERFRTHSALYGESKMEPFIPDQITVNEYPPGEGIGSHIDTHSVFHETLVSLSLAGSTVMTFRHSNTQEKVNILLPPRSLLVLRGDSRFAWQHSIAFRKRDRINGQVMARGKRVSLTFRTVRQSREPCRCEFPSLCDSQQGFIPLSYSTSSLSSSTSPSTLSSSSASLAVGVSSSSPTQQTTSLESSFHSEEPSPLPSLRSSPTDVLSNLSTDAADALESEHVHKFYDAIAAHFHHTRMKPWPKVEQYVRNLPSGSLVADIGCGTGRYMSLNRSIAAVGCDISPKLALIASQQGLSVCLADTLQIPFRSNTFDVVLSIAVLHHISTPQRRLQALHELFRIAKPNGQVFVCAWSFEQDETSRRQFSQQDVFVPWHLPFRFVDDNESGHASPPASSQVSEEKKSMVLQRYCHVYRKGELESLVEEVRGEDFSAEISHTYFDHCNWCVLAFKRPKE